MKVTSFELSQKLAQIGFGKDLSPSYYWEDKETLWHLTEIQLSGNEGMVAAWDLETLISALPEIIQYNSGVYSLSMNNNKRFNYLCEPAGQFPYGRFGVDFISDDKSLADAAARLLILLFEKGLIQFE